MNKEMNDETQEVIDAFNNISKEVGTVAFKVKYTAIPSNREIHKNFSKFCFEEANNNYLSGINLLLKYSKIFDWLDRIEERLTQVESNMDLLRNWVIGEVKNGKKENNEDDSKEEGRESSRPKTF